VALDTLSLHDALPICNFLRDFVFNVSKDTSEDKLFVGGSNNSNNASIQENLESGNHYEVTSAGWYTLQHHFYEDVDGYLAVDLRSEEHTSELQSRENI